MAEGRDTTQKAEPPRWDKALGPKEEPERREALTGDARRCPECNQELGRNAFKSRWKVYSAGGGQIPVSIFAVDQQEAVMVARSIGILLVESALVVRPID